MTQHNKKSLLYSDADVYGFLQSSAVVQVGLTSHLAGGTESDTVVDLTLTNLVLYVHTSGKCAGKKLRSPP